MSKPIFSVESFAEFLGSRDPDEIYDYTNGKTCAIGQYFREKGVPFKLVGPTYWMDEFGICGALPRGFNEISIGGCGASRDKTRTFGKAHERALKYLEKAHEMECANA